MASLMLVVVAGAAAEAPPPAEPIIHPVTTDHKALINGHTIAYQATFAESPLGNDPAHPVATLSSTTYLRTDVPNVASRPIIFAFNGGPGASSTPLHLHGLGPRRIVGPDQGHKESYVADNPYSLIDVADLVFIDPVGTGLSRVLPGGDGHPFWSPDGDAKEVLGFIHQWLDKYHRERSPIYLVGESYGGYRLATMMKLLGDQRIQGLVLISPELDPSASDEAKGNDQPYISNLPTMAAAAWFHNKVDRRGLTLDAFVRHAEDFAAGEYATALQRGDTLAPERLTDVARKLSGYIGLSVQQIVTAHLRMSSEEYLNDLLADKDLRLGRLDTRITGPLNARTPKGIPTNDPSLVVSQNVGITDHYFRSELSVPTSRRYIPVAFDVNAAWNWSDDKAGEQGWRFYVNGAPFIGAVATKQPQMKVLLVGGLFDMATSWYGARYAINHAGIPTDRVTEVAFDAGHTVYESDDNLKRFSLLLHGFVEGKKNP